MALDELTAASKKQVEVFFEDDQFNSAAAVSAFNDMAIKELDLVVLFAAQSSAAVVPLAERRGIASVTIAAQKQLVEGRRLALRHWIDSGLQARLLVPEVKNRKFNTFSTIYSAHEGTTDLVNQFRIEAKKAGLSESVTLEVPPNERDFRTILSRFPRRPSEALIVALLPGQLSTFAKQLAELQITSKMFGFAPAENGAEVEAGGRAMEGLIYIGPDYTEEFIEAYERRYNSYPEAASGNGYDIVKMVNDAVMTGASSSEEVVEKLRAIKEFDGSMGKYGIGDSNSFAIPAIAKIVSGGKFRKLSSLTHVE